MTFVSRPHFETPQITRTVVVVVVLQCHRHWSPPLVPQRPQGQRQLWTGTRVTGTTTLPTSGTTNPNSNRATRTSVSDYFCYPAMLNTYHDAPLFVLCMSNVHTFGLPRMEQSVDGIRRSWTSLSIRIRLDTTARDSANTPWGTLTPIQVKLPIYCVQIELNHEWYYLAIDRITNL